jgi:hypothetical protein
MTDILTKTELTERQHAEMLMFATETLQDMRDQQSIQREVVAAALLLFGGAIGLLEHVNNARPWRLPIGVAVSAIAVVATMFVLKEQAILTTFRQRLRTLYADYFAFDLQPITRLDFRDRHFRSGSSRGHRLSVYIGLILGSALVSILWIVL